MGEKDQTHPAENQKIAVIQAKDKHQEAALDEALKESFPASDPIAVSFPHAVVNETPKREEIPGKLRNNTKNNTKCKSP